MKKYFILALALVMLLAVSCATTAAADVEPVVREVKISDYASKAYSADDAYKMLERFAKDVFDEDECVLDAKAKTLTVKGYDLESNVGPLAQEGVVIVDIVMEAQEDTIMTSLVFVESYYVMEVGFFEKKISQGITELGLKAIEYQADYISNYLESLLAQYTILVDNNMI